MRRVAGSRLPALGALVLVAAVAGACLPGAGPASAPGRSCVGLPQDVCIETFAGADERARERGTIVVGIVVRCTTVCSNESGDAEQTVTFADGTKEQGGFGWSSAMPAPVGQPIEPAPSLAVDPTCHDIDQVTCAARALEAVDDLDVDPATVISIDVRCTPGPCSTTDGDGETTVTMIDGRVTTVGWSYGSGR
ncbi:MAG: hypothetical protein ACHQ02_02640 [Candidatus Limnocylindrales bacterium]